MGLRWGEGWHKSGKIRQRSPDGKMEQVKRRSVYSNDFQCSTLVSLCPKENQSSPEHTFIFTIFKQTNNKNKSMQTSKPDRVCLGAPLSLTAARDHQFFPVNIWRANLESLSSPFEKGLEKEKKTAAKWIVCFDMCPSCIRICWIRLHKFLSVRRVARSAVPEKRKKIYVRSWLCVRSCVYLDVCVCVCVHMDVCARFLPPVVLFLFAWLPLARGASNRAVIRLLSGPRSHLNHARSETQTCDREIQARARH